MKRVATDLSAKQVRRIALTAQGFGSPRPARPTIAHLRRLLSRLGAIQIDAVNVLVRSHYLPVFSRLGPYKTDLFDRLAYGEGGAFEYVAHAAAIVDVDLYPALRWRMTRNQEHPQWTNWLAKMEAERPGYADVIRAEVAERGPLSFGELVDPARRPTEDARYATATLLWDRGSDGKTMLDCLYMQGELAVARRDNFKPKYDLTERVIPPRVLAAPALSKTDGQRELVRRATAALGVATVKDVADYFRMSVADTTSRLKELVADGELTECRPGGWPTAGFLHPSARTTPVQASALLGPFDSLLWERSRVVRVFGFRHSFEIYVPEAKRTYGYFVLPFLLGDRIQGRVDLKADRAQRRLLVRGSFAEPDTDHGEVALALAEELRSLAAWLEVDDISVTRRGNLATALAAAC